MPDAKPFYINFSDDYYYTETRVGSLLEKLQALSALTSTESRFFRVDDYADVAARSSINYYRIFRDEVVKLLSGVIRNDPMDYAATLSTTLPMSGGGVPTYGYQPTPVIDPVTFGDVTAPPPPYMTAPRVLTPVNKSVRRWALMFALARLGSTWDYTLDFQNFLTIGIKGTDDDFTVGASGVVEYTHPETGLVYRATTNTAGTSPNIGKQIITELNDITGTAGVPGTIPVSITSYTNGDPLPNWYTAKADLDAAVAAKEQMAYETAIGIYNYVNSLVGYRLDLVGDIRLFRKMLLLP